MYPTGTDNNSVFNKKWDKIWVSTIDYTYITYQRVPVVHQAQHAFSDNNTASNYNTLSRKYNK